MVVSLISNITRYMLDIGPAHSKCSLTILPSEPFKRGKLFVYLGGLPCEKLGNLAGRQSWRCHDQSVDVILDSTYLQSGHLVLSCDAANVRPNALLIPRLSHGCRFLVEKTIW